VARPVRGSKCLCRAGPFTDNRAWSSIRRSQFPTASRPSNYAPQPEDHTHQMPFRFSLRNERAGLGSNAYLFYN
jgi:hypothetical protein